MAEFVEQRDHVVVRQQRRLAINAFGKIADQVRHRLLQRTGIGAQPACAHVVHPGAAPLARARGLVEVELAQQLAAALNAVKRHGGVPRRCRVRADGHVEQGFDDLEQARQHLGCGEVLLDLLFAEGVTRFLELFGDVGPVPGLRVADAQVLGGKSARVLHIALGIGACAACQVAQEGDDLGGRLRHLRHQGHFGEAGVAQQPCLFLAQRQDFLNQRRVVEAPGIALGLVGRARHVGAVQALAQCGVVGELHHRQVAGHFQRQLVAGLAVGLSGGTCGLGHVGGQAGDFGRAGVVGVAVGGVERVFAELLAQLGLALLDLRETLLGRALQFRAGEHEVAHRVVQRLALLAIERGGVDGLVLGVQALIRGQACPELGDSGQCLVVSRAQRGRVGHAVEVADGAPGTAQLFGGNVKLTGDGVPVGRKVWRGDTLQRRIRGHQQGVYRRGHVVRGDAVEQRQILEIEEGIAHAQSDGGARKKVQAASRSAASSVLTSSMVMVMGPTPPGTGVI